MASDCESNYFPLFMLLLLIFLHDSLFCYVIIILIS